MSVILFLTVCYNNVTYVFQSKFTFYSYLNVKELLAWKERDSWSLSDSDGIQAGNHKYLRLKNYERKINSLFNIYANFESILVLGDNEKQSSQKYTRNKYQNHVVWSYSYKLVYVDDKISQPFQS